MTIETWDLSGMGEGYEATCQKMLWNAVKFMNENKLTELQTTQL